MNAHALFSISPMEIMNTINERFKKKRESEHRLIHWMLQWQWVCLCGKGWGNSHNNRWHCYETCSTLFVLCVCVLRQTGTIQRTPTSISKTHTISQMLFFPSFLHLYAIRVHFNIFLNLSSYVISHISLFARNIFHKTNTKSSCRSFISIC